MNKETIFLSLTALIIGLVVAGGIFFGYQYLIKPKTTKDTTITLDPTPTPVSSNSEELMVNTPEDETVIDKKTVTISGKTIPGSAVVISSENDEQVAEPADNGDFSVSTTLSDGANSIQITTILPSGEERKVMKTITYSTESF